MMKIALDEAKIAAERDEVPVGAVVVMDGKIIAKAKNNREETGDATGHAEMLAIREACEVLGTWRLDSCELYVTLEPCPMCMGAAINSRIKRIVFGAKDAKAGALGSLINLNAYPLNHKPEVTFGVLEKESTAMLQAFFMSRRRKNNP